MTFFGSMITYVAVPFQVYQLTGSSRTDQLVPAAALNSFRIRERPAEGQTTPYASIASATFLKPAMFAPRT